MLDPITTPRLSPFGLAPWLLQSFALPAAVFLALWLAGGPRAHFDDVVFAGPALQVQEGNPLSNPYMVQWDPELSDKYLIHGSLYPLALGGWLWLIGVSRQSMTAFPCLMLAVAASAFSTWLRNRGRPHAWVSSPLVCIFFFTQGLRQDSFGLALLAVALALTTLRGGFVWFPVGLLAVATVVTWPVLLGYVVGLLGAELLGTRRDWARNLGVAIAGGMAGVALVGVSIGWQFRAYLLSYGHHVAMVRGGASAWRGLLFEVTNGWAPLLYAPLYFLLLLGLATCAVRWRLMDASARRCTWGMTLGLVANIVLQTKPMHQVFDFFASVLLACFAVTMFPLARQRLFTVVVALAICWTKSYEVLEMALQDRSLGDVATARDAAIASGKQIWFDDVAARYVFNYHLPEGSRYWNFTRAYPQVWPLSTKEKPPGVVWVIARAKADECEGLERSERVSLAGRRFASMPKKPFEIVVLE